MTNSLIRLEELPLHDSTFGTLDAHCSSIAHRHGQDGLPDPTAHVLVRRVRRGLRRVLGVAPRRQAHPLTVDELGRIVSSIDASTAMGKRDRTVLLVGYASAMRPGDVSALNAEDILRKPTGVVLAIRRSKLTRKRAANSSKSYEARTP